SQLDLFWIRARIRDGFYDIEPRLRYILLNLLPCSQKQTIQGELLGEGNGKPDQSFELLNKPVLVPDTPDQTPVVIEVDDETWSPVSSFKDSGPDSKHYVFDPETGVVEFGNGLNGQIPKQKQLIRAAWYQASAGGSGNVAKDLNWKS